LYWPKRQILEGEWNPPAVKRTSLGAKKVA
jgi:hypothetical protein